MANVVPEERIFLARCTFVYLILAGPAFVAANEAVGLIG